nr:MAG TPA: hypothetical protein [Caudoviricetes sp.]
MDLDECRFSKANWQDCTTSSLTDMPSSCATCERVSASSFVIRNVLFTYSCFLILNSIYMHLTISLVHNGYVIYTAY